MTDTNNTDGAAFLPVSCHFCKSGTIATTLHAAGLSWAQVECTNDECDATGPCRNTEAEAIAAWNAIASHSLPGDVGMREALESLSLAADEINGDIDLQVNGDHSEEVEVNGEYYVTLSAAKVDALNKAICVAQRLLKQAPTPPANPTIEKILTLAKRKYHFQPKIGAVLRAHMPTGTTGHDWDDKEAFSQAIAILDLIPALAALSSPLPATQEDGARALSDLQRLGQEYDGEAVREALKSVKDSCRIGKPGTAPFKSKWVHMPASVYHMVCAALNPAQATPSALSGDAGEGE